MQYFEEMLLIQVSRVYDVMLALYGEVAGPEKASELLKRHSQGNLFSPAPSYRSDDKSEN